MVVVAFLLGMAGAPWWRLHLLVLAATCWSWCISLAEMAVVWWLRGAGGWMVLVDDCAGGEVVLMTGYTWRVAGTGA